MLTISDGGRGSDAVPHQQKVLLFHIDRNETIGKLPTITVDTRKRME